MNQNFQKRLVTRVAPILKASRALLEAIALEGVSIEENEMMALQTLLVEKAEILLLKHKVPTCIPYACDEPCFKLNECKEDCPLKAAMKPEQEPVGNAIAWKIGSSCFLAMEKRPNGWTYHIFDQTYHRVDTGYVHSSNPRSKYITMLDARQMILEYRNLEDRSIVPLSYDKIMLRAALNPIIKQPQDGFAILQLKRTDKTMPLRFVAMDYLIEHGLKPECRNYDVIYCSQLHALPNKKDTLEALYTKFNLSIPDDFKGHSLSMSDIVILKDGDTLSAYYTDKVGFIELENFI